MKRLSQFLVAAPLLVSALVANAAPAPGLTNGDRAISPAQTPPADTLRAHEPFAAAAGSFLHGLNGGSGFAAPWAVLGFDGNANQFRTANIAPLASGHLATSGNYLLGGYNNFTSSRRLDVAGAFPDHLVVGSNPAVIGRDGATLWVSALLRREVNDSTQTAFSLVNADDIANVNNIRVGAGYYGAPSDNGGQRFWTLLVNNPPGDNFTFVRTTVPITNGVAALVVLRIQFGVTDQIDLFVNPALGGVAPVAPAASRSTTGGANILFRALGFWTSANDSNGSLDEIRLGDSVAAVTPTNPPVAAPGSVQFSTASFTVGESGGTATITVSRVNGTSGVAGVSYAASNGTATAGSDYAAAGGSLIWADGEAADKTFIVSIANDATAEGDETVNLTLTNPTGATLGVPSAATLTIMDDDGVTSLAIVNPSFELPVIAAGTFSTTSAPPGWSVYGNGLNFGARTIGVLHPATTTLYAGPVPHGQNVGVIFLMDNPTNQTFFAGIEAGMQQTLAATLQARTRYTVRVEVGNIANDANAPFQFGGFPNYRIDLLAGTNALASDNNALLPGEGRFLTSTVTVATASSHPLAGQPLGVRLVNLNSAPGIEVNFDNVRLDAAPAGPPPLALVRTGAVWKYLDDQTDPGAAWRAPGFNDAGWSNGVAQLGFGDGDETTVFRRLIGETPIITAYFRRTFVAPPPANFTELQLRLLRDDGGVVYLNGVEVFRSNMPGGAISYNTFAVVAVPTGPEEGAFYFATNFPPTLLVEGENTLAVEVHQITQFSSTDMSFDCELLAQRDVVPVTPPVLSIVHEQLLGRIRLSWPDSGPGAFFVQASPSLAAPIVWSPLPGIPVLDTGVWSLSFPTPAGPQFFRLQSPEN